MPKQPEAFVPWAEIERWRKRYQDLSAERAKRLSLQFGLEHLKRAVAYLEESKTRETEFLASRP